MIRVNAAVVIWLMASHTCIGGIVVIATNMTGCAIIRNWDMRTREGEDSIVVKSRRCPGRLGMAGGTIRGELVGSVIRIGGGAVIRSMAAKAGIRGIVVIAVVA